MITIVLRCPAAKYQRPARDRPRLQRRRRRRQDIGDGGGGKTSATAAEEEARVGRANWGEERRGRGRLQVVGGVLNRGEMACRRAIGFPERGPPLRPRARVQLPASRSGQLVPFVRL
jgi:hypothetical protein